MLTIGYACPPPAVPIQEQMQAQEPSVPGRKTLLQPYASPVDLRNGSGLGVVLPFPERTRATGPGIGPWLSSEPEQLYWDTELGTIPSDDEIAFARGLCHTPVHSGWGRGFVNFGDAVLGENTEALSELAAHQKRMFWLSIISTAAIATVAAVSVYKLLKE